MIAPRRLEVVPTAGLPEPPYPADTRARGWKFELDVERIVDSDTWALTTATPELRPWLLMLWAMSWRSTPCGSLPDDDRLIAARIGMPLVMFQTHRDTLMRGWTRHADGRLYHEVITTQVLTLLEVRAGSAKRQAERRAKEKQSLTRNVASQFGEVTRDSTVSSPPVPEPVPEPVKQPLSTPNGVDVVDAHASPTAKPAKSKRECPDCPHDLIVAAYHELLPTCTRVVEWSAHRRAILRARWREKFVAGKYETVEQGVRYWRRYFDYVAKSAFLTGKADPQPGRKVFVADLEWLVRPQNFAKVVEGKFHEPA